MRSSSNLRFTLYDIPDRWSNVTWNYNWEIADTTIHDIKSNYLDLRKGGASNGDITAPKFIGSLEGNASTATNVDWGGVENKPSTYPPSSHTHPYLPLTGGSVTGNITATKFIGPLEGKLSYANASNIASSWIDGNKGKAFVVGNTADHTVLFRGKSTNGVFTIYNYNNNIGFTYTSDGIINSGSNAVDRNLILLNESGDSYFPGNINVSGVVNGKVNGLHSSFITSAFLTNVGEASSNNAWSSYNHVIGLIRTQDAGINGIPQYSPGLFCKIADTQFYMSVGYNGSEVWFGGGNGNAINWRKQVSFTDHNHDASYLKLVGGTISGNLVINGNLKVNRNGTMDGFSIGDDFVLGDCNQANTMCLVGAQNGEVGYIRFGNGSNGSNPTTAWLGFDAFSNKMAYAYNGVNEFVGSIRVKSANGIEMTGNGAGIISSMDSGNHKWRIHAAGNQIYFDGAAISGAKTKWFIRHFSGTASNPFETYQDQIILHDENNNSTFPGNVAANSFSNASGTNSFGHTIFTQRPTFNQGTHNNYWYYTRGDYGWYNETYGGGIYMNDSTWVRTYGGKSFYAAGNISAGGVVANAKWNDYAEYYEKGEPTEPGDIITVDLKSDKETYIKAVEGDIVIGVHSDTYGYVVGGDEPDDMDQSITEYNEKNFIPIGLKGRVYVKVIGDFHKGDKIVPSKIPGVGRKMTDNDSILSLVGIVCENLNTDGEIKRVRIHIK